MPRRQRSIVQKAKKWESSAHYWHQDILKRMKINVAAFYSLEESESKTYTDTSPCCLWCEVRFDQKGTFCTRWTLDVCTSIVAHESVRFAFFVSAVNRLDLLLKGIKIPIYTNQQGRKPLLLNNLNLGHNKSANYCNGQCVG